VIATIPTLLGWDFGKLFDIKGSKMFTLGLLSFAVLIFMLVFLRSYAWQVFIYFMVNMVLELLSVGSLELMTTHTKPEHFGKVDGFIKSTEYIGAVVGPLAAGIIMDAYGFASAYIVFTAILVFLAAMFYILQRKGYMERPVVLEEPMLEK
jgi:predicted MFS family arabinose efflux permease